MRQTLGVLVTLLIASTLSAQTGKQALIEKLLALTFQPQSGFDYSMTVQNLNASDTAERDRVTRAMTKVTVATYEADLSEDDLKQVIAFLQTPAGRRYAAATAKVNHDRFGEVQGELAPALNAAEKPRRATVSSLLSLATAAEAWAIDNNRYPDAKDIDALIKILKPVYLTKPPRSDEWGTPFVYIGRGMSYTFVSAGPDRKIDKRSLTAKTPADANPSDDIIYADGVFIQNGE